jgi:25S rRNA (cytosine2278-C5)-methyltransferase
MSREYLVAGKCVEAVVYKSQSFKGYCSNIKLGKVDYALAAESMKYVEVLHTLLDRCKINLATLDVNKGIFLVMAYEVLFGNGKIKGGGKVKRKVMEHISPLKIALSELMEEKNTKVKSDLLPSCVTTAASMPMYIRINVLKLSITEGFRIVESICSKARMDPIIPSLIILPPDTRSFGEHPRVQDGSLIIQDKASCIPSQSLIDFWKGGDVIDACAAPGNKTSHIAAGLVHSNNYYDQSKRPCIIAYDRDRKRATLLKNRLRQAGADFVEVRYENFLNAKVSAAEFKDVRNILCDPSCSGSGLVRSLDRIGDGMNINNDRLLSLQTLQIAVVEKALSFPAVEHVVYSTCSIHDIENEDVVAHVLQSHPDWTVECPTGMKEWKRRGHSHPRLSINQSDALIRCLPSDGLNGFFVANFIKRRNRKIDVNTELDSQDTEKYASNHSAGLVIKNRRKRRRIYMWKPLHIR